MIQDHLQEMTIMLNTQGQTNKQSLFKRGVKIWNNLPCEMRQMSKNNFKINVHDTLLRILSGENDYIDLHDLTTKIS